MAVKAYFVIGESNRDHICRNGIMRADVGDVVRIEDPSKSREQEMKYHAMFADVARSCEFMGKKWHRDDWKRLLVEAFVQEMREQAMAVGDPDPFGEHGQIVPSLDFRRTVQLGVQTRDFTRKIASQFIEHLHAWGVDNKVAWSEKSKRFFAQELAWR